jgi:alkanesulfonate monooxygenase SsuD/methylene tetrahydromethanopterin reductase-like flavin-dependent oxidoreductase (luciferase family)
VIAALGRKMLRLAAEIGDGAFSNFLPVSGVRQVVDAFGAPEKELACRFFLFEREEEAMPAAKRVFAGYATVPVYAEFFRWLGWGERIDPVVEAWHAGDRARALELVPEELVREVFLFGPPERQRERIEEFVEAGITTPVLSPLVAAERLDGFVESLAPAHARR